VAAEGANESRTTRRCSSSNSKANASLRQRAAAHHVGEHDVASLQCSVKLVQRTPAGCNALGARRTFVSPLAGGWAAVIRLSRGRIEVTWRVLRRTGGWTDNAAVPFHGIPRHSGDVADRAAGCVGSFQKKCAGGNNHARRAMSAAKSGFKARLIHVKLGAWQITQTQQRTRRRPLGPFGAPKGGKAR